MRNSIAEPRAPNGWRSVRLGELARIHGGGRLRLTKSDYQATGVAAFSAAGQDGFVALEESREPAVILSSIGARCGKCFYPSGPWTTLANTQAIIPDPTVCDARYLYEYVNDEAYWFRSGSAQPFIAPSTIKSAWISLPPLDEQRRIAAVLSAMDRGAETAEAVGTASRGVFDALLEQFLSPPESSLTKATPWGHAPASWEVRRCDELFDVRLGKMMSAEARLGACAVPYLRNQNVYWERFDLSDVASMDIQVADRERFRVRRGDILACEGRFIGRSAVWERDEPIYYQKALHRLRARDGRINPHFMQFFMQLRFRLRDDLSREAQATSTIPHFPLERMVKLAVPVPPRAEQDRIVRILQSVHLRAQRETELARCIHSTKRELSAHLLGETN